MQPAWCLRTHPASRSRARTVVVRPGIERDRHPARRHANSTSTGLAVALAYARERRGSNRDPLSAAVSRAVRREVVRRVASGAFEGSRVNACSSGHATSSVTCGAPTTGRARSAAAAARKTPPRPPSKPRPPSNKGLASRRPGLSKARRCGALRFPAGLSCPPAGPACLQPVFRAFRWDTSRQRPDRRRDSAWPATRPQPGQSRSRNQAKSARCCSAPPGVSQMTGAPAARTMSTKPAWSMCPEPKLACRSAPESKPSRLSLA